MKCYRASYGWRQCCSSKACNGKPPLTPFAVRQIHSAQWICCTGIDRCRKDAPRVRFQPSHSDCAALGYKKEYRAVHFLFLLFIPSHQSHRFQPAFSFYTHYNMSFAASSYASKLVRQGSKSAPVPSTLFQAKHSLSAHAKGNANTLSRQSHPDPQTSLQLPSSQASFNKISATQRPAMPCDSKGNQPDFTTDPVYLVHASNYLSGK